jgi:hypothetical protein
MPGNAVYCMLCSRKTTVGGCARNINPEPRTSLQLQAHPLPISFYVSGFIFIYYTADPVSIPRHLKIIMIGLELSTVGVQTDTARILHHFRCWNTKARARGGCAGQRRNGRTKQEQGWFHVHTETKQTAIITTGYINLYYFKNQHCHY